MWQLKQVSIAHAQWQHWACILATIDADENTIWNEISLSENNNKTINIFMQLLKNVFLIQPEEYSHATRFIFSYINLHRNIIPVASGKF